LREYTGRITGAASCVEELESANGDGPLDPDLSKVRPDHTPLVRERQSGLRFRSHFARTRADEKRLPGDAKPFQDQMIE